MNMVDMLRRNPLMMAGILLLLLGILASSVVVVPETKQALVLRFGEPVRIANAYHEQDVFGRTGAGLLTRIPFVESLVWVDKRVLDFDMERQPVLSTDQRRLDVNAYARYRIVDPVRMYVAAGSEQRVSDALKPILGSSLRNELDYERSARVAQDAQNQETYQRMSRLRSDYIETNRKNWGSKIIVVVHSRKSGVKMRDMVQSLAKYVEFLPREAATQ